MALADNWYTFIGLNGGEAGARDMFEKVMEELLRHINDKDAEPVRVSVPTELILRGTEKAKGVTPRTKGR